MTLAVDIGNSGLKYALFSGCGEITRRGAAADPAALVAALTAGAPGKIALVGVASVVPRKTRAVARALEKVTGLPVTLVGWRDVPVRALVDHPERTGVDRLLNAAAAGAFHGRPAVVVDCGTALTFDLLDELGRFDGGVIAPSPQLCRDCLAEKTALLPVVELAAPARLVGKNTVDCLRSGLVLGFADLANGILRRLAGDWRPDFTLVATGGGIGVLLPFLPDRTIHDPDLTLKGVFLAIQRRASA